MSDEKNTAASGFAPRIPEPESEHFYTDRAFQSNVDEAVLDIAYQEAVRKLDSQMESYRHIERTSSVLLGWLFAGFVSLAAAVVALYCSGGVTVPFIMAVYALAALVAPAAVLVRGIHFKQFHRTPGMLPSVTLSPSRCEWIAGSEAEGQTKYYKIGLLQSYQSICEENAAGNLRRIRLYRTAVRILAVECAVAAVLFCVLISL